MYGGSGGAKKVFTSKFSGSWAIAAKIADVGPPGAPKFLVWETKSLNLNPMKP